jgi:hypothetical protein
MSDTVHIPLAMRAAKRRQQAADRRLREERRERIATHMMAAWRASEQHGSRGDSSSDYFASMAVQDADALIAALESSDEV